MIAFCRKRRIRGLHDQAGAGSSGRKKTGALSPDLGA